jgi:L-asparaginase
MPKSAGIHFILTGGTIDSYYEATKDTVIPSVKSIVPEIIKSLQLTEPLKFTQVCMKDSRNLQPKDREKILATIKKSPYEKILITHGTYTMPDTARFLKVNLKQSKKIIILTGSMIPIKGFSPSDGTFNLGYALGRFPDLKPGIYVAMNGRIFKPEEVIKNIYSGKFASIFGEE